MLSIYRLPNMLSGEKVVKVMRRDTFILFKKILLFVVLLILPLIFFYLVLSTNSDFVDNEIFYPLLVLGVSAYYLFIWLFFFFSFIDYYLDVWIITSERIIDIQQKGFFSRIIAEQKLTRVQDVTSETSGMIPTIFKYGDVHIQTAGEVQRFNFQEVPYPDEVRDLIIKLVQRKRKEKPQEEF